MAITPNFPALAQQQGQINQQAANAQTRANRADQYTHQGSLTWGQNPDGSWYQNTNLRPEYQNLDLSITNGQNTLAGRIGQGVNTNGLQDWGSTDITAGVSQMPDGSFGASQQVIDAIKALQQPGLNQARDAERARLAAMGITLGSDASNNSERVLGGTQNDADLKAILAGTQEYGNVFNRQLAQRQQGVDENLKRSNLATALRNSQFQERVGQNASDIAGLSALGGARVDPKFASYAGATALPPPNMYGAATDLFNAQIAQENSQRANAQAVQQGHAGLVGAGVSALGGLSGIGGLLGQGANLLGSAWNGITNGLGGLFGGGGAGFDSSGFGAGGFDYGFGNNIDSNSFDTGGWW